MSNKTTTNMLDHNGENLEDYLNSLNQRASMQYIHPSTHDVSMIENALSATQIDERIAAIVGAAPETLNTLEEIASAIDNNPNFASDMQDALNGKVNTSDFTAENLITILNEGSGGSISNADTVDGYHANAFLLSDDFTGANILSELTTADGSGSGLDADKLDGLEASAFARASNGVLTGPKLYKYIYLLDYDDSSGAGTGFKSYIRNGVWYLNKNTNETNSLKISIDGGLVWHSKNDGAGSGLDADLLDGQQGSSYLRSNANNTTATGSISTSGSYMQVGRGGGSVALTINDGYGNANVAFNHKDGKPDISGNSGRIEMNVDSTSGATMNFELGSGTVAGTATGLTTVMSLTETGAKILNKEVAHLGNMPYMSQQKILNETFLSGTTSLTINDSFVVEATCRVDVIAQAEVSGTWDVEYSNGSITITSTAQETSNIPVKVFITKTGM